MSPRPIRKLILTGTRAGEVSASAAARGLVPPDAMRVAAAPVTGDMAPHAARDGAKAAGYGGCHQARASDGHGQTAADERHAINTIAEARPQPGSTEAAHALVNARAGTCRGRPIPR
jgi:hypothetical protein